MTMNLASSSYGKNDQPQLPAMGGRRRRSRKSRKSRKRGGKSRKHGGKSRKNKN